MTARWLPAGALSARSVRTWSRMFPLIESSLSLVKTVVVIEHDCRYEARQQRRILFAPALIPAQNLGDRIVDTPGSSPTL